MEGQNWQKSYTNLVVGWIALGQQATGFPFTYYLGLNLNHKGETFAYTPHAIHTGGEW